VRLQRSSSRSSLLLPSANCVEGAYGNAPWQVLASVPAADGSYEARLRLDQKGVLHVRVTYPNGRHAVGKTDVG
jgi:hypothetical protein